MSTKKNIMNFTSITGCIVWSFSWLSDYQTSLKQNRLFLLNTDNQQTYSSNQTSLESPPSLHEKPERYKPHNVYNNLQRSTSQDLLQNYQTIKQVKIHRSRSQDLPENYKTIKQVKGLNETTSSHSSTSKVKGFFRGYS